MEHAPESEAVLFTWIAVLRRGGETAALADGPAESEGIREVSAVSRRFPTGVTQSGRTGAGRERARRFRLGCSPKTEDCADSQTGLHHGLELIRIRSVVLKPHNSKEADVSLTEASEL